MARRNGPHGIELRELAELMAASMPHRGPDDQGVWLAPDGRAALSHRRLSVIDTSSASHQPMVGRNGSAAITYNGELYNFREIRTELEVMGERFYSTGDTEVLLKALECWGVAALDRLDGMFAFLYYDVASRRLLAARDIFGEKPLYYMETERYVAFSSELTALTLLPDFDATIEPSAIAAYLSFQYVPAPGTIYRSVRKILPGHRLMVDEWGGVSTDRYFVFQTSNQKSSSRQLGELADELEDILVRSVKTRMIADVPLGAFLSGGVDSSTIAAIATRRLGIDLQTFSIGFAGHADSEHIDAAEIARLLDTEHHDRVLSTDTVSLGSHIGAVLDEPNGDTSCLPTHLLCEFARERVTVALSGDGGDELFGGYGRYFNTVDEWRRKLDGDSSLGWWSSGEVYLSNRVLVFDDEALAQLIGSIPQGHATELARLREVINEDNRPLINVLREFDARTYLPGAVLPKVDRMSMQHSLEVRAPLLGREVAKFASRLSADDCYAEGQGKLVLKAVAERYLPAEWMRRRKRGFGLPMDMWGVDTLMPALRGLVRDGQCQLSKWITLEQLEAYLGRLERDFHPYRAWSLFVLENWLRHHPARVAADPGRIIEMLPATADASGTRGRFGWLSRALDRARASGGPH